MKKIVVVVAVLLVLGALGGGFYLIGPPAEERTRRLDERRRMDLQRLQLATDLYWSRNNRLPATLDELAAEAGTNIYSRDPQTGQPYSYAVKGGDAYELCAEFARESEGRGDFLVRMASDGGVSRWRRGGSPWIFLFRSSFFVSGGRVSGVELCPAAGILCRGATFRDAGRDGAATHHLSRIVQQLSRSHWNTKTG